MKTQNRQKSFKTISSRVIYFFLKLFPRFNPRTFTFQCFIVTFSQFSFSRLFLPHYSLSENLHVGYILSSSSQHSFTFTTSQMDNKLTSFPGSVSISFLFHHISQYFNRWPSNTFYNYVTISDVFFPIRSFEIFT